MTRNIAQDEAPRPIGLALLALRRDEARARKGDDRQLDALSRSALEEAVGITLLSQGKLAAAAVYFDRANSELAKVGRVQRSEAA